MATVITFILYQYTSFRHWYSYFWLLAHFHGWQPSNGWSPIYVLILTIFSELQWSTGNWLSDDTDTYFKVCLIRQFIIGVYRTPLRSIPPFYANPKFGNNFGVFVLITRKYSLIMRNYTWLEGGRNLQEYVIFRGSMRVCTSKMRITLNPLHLLWSREFPKWHHDVMS